MVKKRREQIFSITCPVGNCYKQLEDFEEAMDHLMGTHHMSRPQAKSRILQS